MKIFTLVIAIFTMAHLSAESDKEILATNKPTTINIPTDDKHNSLIAALTKIAKKLTLALQKNIQKTHKHMPTEIDEGILYLEDLVRDLSNTEIAFEGKIRLICGEAQHYIPKNKNLSRNERLHLLAALTQLNRNIETIFSEQQIVRHVDHILADNFINGVNIGCVLENLEKLKNKLKEKYKNVDQDISQQITQLSERTTAITELALQIANLDLKKINPQ